MSKEEYDFDDEDISPLREAAHSMHELYITLKDAGFSRRDSIELIAKILTGTISETISTSSDEDEE